MSISEYWTLARDGDGWRVVSIEHQDDAAHQLDAPIVAGPSDDTLASS